MQNVDTKKLTTIKIGGQANYIYKLKQPGFISHFLKEYKNHSSRFVVLGGGSNIFFNDNLEDLSILKIEILGKEKIKETSKDIIIKFGAGESWQGVVDFVVNKDFSGIESLSGIPGTVGAAPVQNIGAYGSEIKNSLEFVEAYDTKNEEFVILKNKECDFGYRESVFKNNPGRWLITHVAIRLSKNKGVSIPKYKDTEKYFESWDIKNIKLRDIKNAINKIRSNKLPDPGQIPNCGSFFKNPVVENNFAQLLKQKFADIPTFSDQKGVKIPAGYLIEKAGFKGKKLGNIEVYQNNALVLTNPETKASFQEILEVKNTIEKQVYKIFGIKLETEVNIIS